MRRAWMKRGALPALATVTLVAALGATGAMAAEPWWHLSTMSAPAEKAGGEGQVIVEATNLGDRVADGRISPVTVRDTLPAGVEPTAVYGEGGGGESGFREEKEHGNCSIAGQTVTCVYMWPLMPYERLSVAIAVKVTPGAGDGLNEATVTGGGAASRMLRGHLSLEGSEPSFGVQSYEVTPEEEGGAPDTQAGSHPFQMTTTLAVGTHTTPVVTGTGERKLEALPNGLAKDLSFNLPPGLIGNAAAMPKCNVKTFTQEAANRPGFQCPADTVVGAATSIVNILGSNGAPNVPGALTRPIYNLEPGPGEPARFGFPTPTVVGVVLNTSVRTGGDYGVTVSTQNITQLIAFVGSQVTFWGDPSNSRHDSQRGECLAGNGAHVYVETGQERSCPLSEPEQPFLIMPTSCETPPRTSVVGDSWSAIGSFTEPFSYTFADELGRAYTMDGCNKLSFEPEVSVAPDVPDASSPSGLEVKVHVPQEASLNPEGDAESQVRDTTVALPAGVSLNPGGAGGLEACGESQIGYLGHETPGEAAVQAFSSGLPSPFCPKAAKVGTVDIHTPLLPNDLTGAVYLGEPAPTGEAGKNPFKSLVAMYIVAEDPVSGTLVKLPGQVVPCEKAGESVEGLTCETAGQLISSFKDTPQLPFENLTLHFFGGGRAPLATPGLCGSYTTKALFTPWSGNPPVQSSSEFKITSGPNGSACPSDPKPFTPEFNTETTNVNAGSYSELRTTMGHPDEDQALGALKMTLPPGLMGSLAHVALCPEPQAAEGTCGPESMIGHTTVTAGLGSTPAVVARPGNVYITGPYKGAPYGLSIANPAETGPFDLEKGTKCDCIVVRAKVEVDPITAQLTVTSDPLPTMIDGIPTDLQHVSVQINRPNFTFNPTSCNPMTVTGALTGAQGAVSPISVPFQVANCASLAFKPSFRTATSGKTSRKNGASLHVLLTYPNAPQGTQANIKSVHVELPKALPSRLSTLNHACVDSVFNQNPANCPSESRVGFAKAVTPVLPVPLEGPAYFVSHGGQKFPELIVILQGYGATVYLQGETFISKAGITSSTFKSVPDVPVGSFELTLPEGQYSALAANTNLCAASLTMPTTFDAQNGAKLVQNTPVEVQGCPYALRIVHRRVHKRTLTLKVSVPVAGKLVANGKGVSKAIKSAKGRQTLTLTLKERRAGKLRSKISLRFTPSGAAGKQRGKSPAVLRKRLVVTFK